MNLRYIESCYVGSAVYISYTYFRLIGELFNKASLKFSEFVVYIIRNRTVVLFLVMSDTFL